MAQKSNRILPCYLGRNIFGGSASSRFHRPPTGIGLDEKAQSHIRSMRLLTAELDVFQCRPDIGYHLLKDRNEDEAYLIYKENAQYAVFFPSGGSVGLDLSETSGEFKVRWLEIANSLWRPGPPVQGGKVVPLNAPSSALWAVLLER